MKVGIDIGADERGQSVACDLEELLATRLLVQGNSGSGKSHLLRRLLEQSAEWVQQAIIDPEGDFVTLAERYGHVVVEAATLAETDIQRIAARAREHRVSVVLNLEGLDVEAQMRCAAAFLGGLFDADRDHWYPMLVVVDEAQLFAPAVAGEVSDEARKSSLGAMTNLMCRGRKRGLAGVIATQRLAKLAKNVAAEASNFLMGRTFLDIDMARAADLLGMERRQAETIRDLERGRFLALGPALARRPISVSIGATLTQARSGSPKLVPLAPKPAEDARDLLFAPGAPEPVRAAPPSKPVRADADDLLRAVSAPPRPRLEAETRTPEPELPAGERDALIDRVLGEVMAEPDAAYRSVAVLYQDFLVRCRIRRVGGQPLDLAAFRRRLAVVRAGVSEGSAGEEWSRATEIAAGMSDDIQGIFLLFARAAMNREPCPSDAEIARAAGSRSTGRARRLLSYLETQGWLVARNDLRGQRIVALPHLGWETAAGDPNAADPAASDGPLPDLFAAE